MTAPRSPQEAWNRCSFRSLVASVEASPESLLRRWTATFVAWGGEPSPIAPNAMADLVQAVRDGNTVAILADRADLRDAAKRELLLALALAGVPVAGRA